MKLSTEAKIYGFFFATFAGVVILGLVTFDSTRNLMATDKSVAHTLEVRDSLDELLSAVQGAENGRRGYLISGDFQYQLQFEAGAAQIRPAVKKIALLTADEPDQQKRIAALTASTEKTIAIWEETSARLPKGKADAAAQIELTNKGAEVTARIISLLDEMTKAEDDLLRIKANAARRTGDRTMATVAMGSGFSAVIVFLAIGLIHRDLSERKQGEERLAKERAFLDLAIASLPGTFCLFDRDGKLLRWNFNLEAISGYSPDEIASMKPLDFFVEEYKPIVQEAIQRVFKEGASDIDAEVLSKNRSRRHYYFNARRILVDGKACAICAGIDMTAHRLAEMKIHEQANLLELARDAIFVRSLDEKIRYWNKGAERLYGWTGEEAIGGDFAKMAYQDRASFEEAKQILFEKGEWSGEVRRLTKARREVLVASRWTLLRDKEGKASSILVIDSDITEKKQLEAQFLRTQRMESIGQLAGGIAHDLNNILAPILMCAQTLHKEVRSLEGTSMLTTIEETARRGAEIVKQITTFAKGVEGKRVLLHPQYLFSETVRIVRETFPKSIVLKTDLKENLWTVFGDATQLHQVLLNLAVNARDAMPQGGTLGLVAEDVMLDEAAVRLMPGLQPGPHVLFRISDTGTGIPPEIADKIFDPFFTTKGPDGGTGLGLSTVMGIVKSHKGIILFESKMGEGTEFRIYLPADLTRMAAEARGIPVAPPQGGGELILIVDDEVAVCTITKRILESNRYRTLVANNGTEAIALFASEAKEINLVLTDLNMPSMSGPDTIAILKKIKPDVRIIVATGADSAHGATSAGELGVQALLKKPFDVFALLDTLHKVLQTPVS
jgi:two-component system, cell cycle sensor histidine kinase and response regulator CckA